MIRRLWRVIVGPWRHDRAFGERMWRMTLDAQAQSRESMRQQAHLRTLRSNPVADDLLGPIPGTARDQR